LKGVLVFRGAEAVMIEMAPKALVSDFSIGTELSWVVQILGNPTLPKILDALRLLV